MDGGIFLSSKSRWLDRHLRCPICGHAGEGHANAWLCSGCDYFGYRIANALNMLGAESATETGPVSAHPYNQSAMTLIGAVETAGGMALDCGAGFRSFTSEHLVQSEIAPYPNIDVLAVNGRLPFADASFDLVFSLDVLEHVPDAHAAAAEIVRVLKPGGTLYVDLPHLQVLHGYPHHYTNFTHSGVRQLFNRLKCKAQSIPDSGHPSHVVHTTLHTFLAGIPKAERERFKAVTVGEILAEPHKALLNRFREGFSEAVKWKMAASTSAIFTKAGGELLPVDPSELPQFTSSTDP